MTRRSHRNDDRGLLATELAILMPLMVVIALTAVFLIRVERHESRTQQAADAAVRAASLTRSEADARAAAQQAASVVCQGPASIDRFDWNPPDLGTYTPGQVTLVVSCTEPFRGFEPLVDDRSRTDRAGAVSSIEYWRSAP